MLSLSKVIKPWKEAAALLDHINLYGFWNETAFLTKSGDLGMVLSTEKDSHMLHIFRAGSIERALPFASCAGMARGSPMNCI
jgi:hypothetical protein